MMTKSNNNWWSSSSSTISQVLWSQWLNDHDEYMIIIIKWSQWLNDKFNEKKKQQTLCFPRLSLRSSIRPFNPEMIPEIWAVTKIDTSYLLQAPQAVSGVNFSRLNAKNAYFTLFRAICCNFLVFFVIFGYKMLGLRNPASVKEMTNMRYAWSLRACYGLELKVQDMKFRILNRFQ